MSLINDALRRSSGAKKNHEAGPASGAPMQPVEPPAKSSAASFGPVLIILIAIVLVAAGWFLSRGWHTPSSQNGIAVLPVERSNTEASVIPAEKSIQPVPAETIPTVRIPSDPTNTSAGIAAQSNETVIAAPVPIPPALKLQGIFYRLKNPTAMINGKSLMIGESISGARVTKIEREQVTLERDGQTLVLTLP